MGVTPIGFAECAAEFSIPGDAGPALIVTGHDVSGLATSTAVGDAIEAGWDIGTPLTDFIQEDYSLVALHIRWQANAGDAVLIERSLSLVGADGNPACPPQVCALATKNTNLAGRKNKGRMYIPGVAETTVDDSGLISAGRQAQLEGALAQMQVDWDSNGASLVILHTDPADTPTPVEFMVVQAKVATQRRRLR